MPNLEWAVTHTLLTPGGNIDLNAATGYRFLIQEESYQIIPTVRVTQDNISQQDGSVLHPRFLTGLIATVKVAYWVEPPIVTENPGIACGTDLRVMHETLSGALNSIRSFTLGGSPQRLRWQPTGYGDRRMLDQILLLGWPQPSYDGLEAAVTFEVESPFPYAIDEMQIVTSIGSGATVTITNAGNTAFWPVVQVHGPTTGFTLTNNTDLDPDGNPLAVVYDATLPGANAITGGHYVEIDFFRGTAYLDGNATNLIAGIDPRYSDLWQLLPGANSVHLTGATATVLSNNSWA